MHFALSAPLVAELAQHPNIIGIKDSSGDMAILSGYIASQSDSFTVITGNGTQFLNGLRAGARGGILAVADFAPVLSRSVYDAHMAGDVAAADAAQAVLAPLATEIVGRLGVPAIKVACDNVGLVGGSVRMPLMDLDAAGRTRVATLLAEAHVESIAKLKGAA
jgi:dihydrodipicolinate synthase/N-acetylneuraminate lyase